MIVVVVVRVFIYNNFIVGASSNINSVVGFSSMMQNS